MADVHTKEIRSKNNLSRYSGWRPLKAGTPGLKCWCAGFYIPIASGNDCTIKTTGNPGTASYMFYKWFAAGFHYPQVIL